MRMKEDFLNHHWLKTYMDGGSFKLNGLIRITEYNWSSANDSMLPGDGRYSKMIQDIRSLTSAGDLSDFTFIVEGRQLEVHKAILAGEKNNSSLAFIA